MTTRRVDNSGAGRKQVLFDMEIDTLDPHVLGVENNVLRALVERLELLASARKQPVPPVPPSTGSKVT